MVLYALCYCRPREYIGRTMDDYATNETVHPPSVQASECIASGTVEYITVTGHSVSGRNGIIERFVSVI